MLVTGEVVHFDHEKKFGFVMLDEVLKEQTGTSSLEVFFHISGLRLLMGNSFVAVPNENLSHNIQPTDKLSILEIRWDIRRNKPMISQWAKTTCVEKLSKTETKVNIPEDSWVLS